jgi:hypothetical protein
MYRKLMNIWKGGGKGVVFPANNSDNTCIVNNRFKTIEGS